MTISRKNIIVLVVSILSVFLISLKSTTAHASSKSDTYNLSASIDSINYDSGTLSVTINDDSNDTTKIKGLSGQELKKFSAQYNKASYTVYDFKLKNKNQFVSYKLNNHT